MKNFKFISLFLLFVILITRSSESSKFTSDVSNCIDSEIRTLDIPDFVFSNLSPPKDLDIHYTVKKKIKYRGTTSDGSTIKTPYYAKVIHFKILKSRLIYGLASIYFIQRHAHLHLYQLF
jgi:hypothetical protein